MINEINQQILQEKEILLKNEKQVHEILLENQRKIEVIINYYYFNSFFFKLIGTKKK